MTGICHNAGDTGTRSLADTVKKCYKTKPGRRRDVRFAVRESPAGRAVRERHPAMRAVESILWVEVRDGVERPLALSDAVLAIAEYLGGGCALLARIGRLVPRPVREAAYGVGATKLEVALQIVVPAALSGIAAAIIVGISRAVGETMIVAVAAGAGPNFTFSPFVGAETITGHIVRISGGDLSYDSIDYNSILALGLFLFIITLTLNIISQAIVRRFREVYE